MNCQVILLSILLGLIPEGIFLAWFIIGAKRMDRHTALHFAVFTIAMFVIIGTVLPYTIWFCILVITLVYISMKVLCKPTEFLDLFLLTIPFLLFGITGYPCYYLAAILPNWLPPNLTTLIINRILIIIILSALYPHLNKWYNAYKKLWNRHKGNKIKSITVRNISILLCNILIMAAYLMLFIRK